MVYTTAIPTFVTWIIYYNLCSIYPQYSYISVINKIKESYLKTRMSFSTRCACMSCQRKKRRVKNTSRFLIFPVCSHINTPQKDYRVVIYTLRMTKIFCSISFILFFKFNIHASGSIPTRINYVKRLLKILFILDIINTNTFNALTGVVYDYILFP